MHTLATRGGGSGAFTYSACQSAMRPPSQCSRPPRGRSAAGNPHAPPHWQAYHASDGHPARLEEVVAAMAGVDVVLLGEYHDDPVAHALELELLQQAHMRHGRPLHGPRRGGEPQGAAGGAAASASAASGPPGDRRRVVLSLEMFERDTQEVLDAYLAGRFEAWVLVRCAPALLAHGCIAMLPQCNKTPCLFYWAGHIRPQDMEKDARAWPNYSRDYRPLVEFAKQQGLAVVAANAPRR